MSRRNNIVSESDIENFMKAINDEVAVRNIDPSVMDREVHRLIEEKELYHVPRIGHMTEKKPQGTFRFLSCQFNGLSSPHVRELKVNMVKKLVDKYEINALCGSEIGVNFDRVDKSHSMASWFSSFSRHPPKSTTSHNVHFPTTSRHLQGGTGIVIFSELLQHAKTKCNDFRKLGRYCSWTFYISPTHRFRFVVVYSTGTQRPKSLGSIYQQQLAYIRNAGINMSPFQLLRSDLRRVLKQWIRDGDRIVLCIDCNESILSGQMQAMLCDELGMLERSHEFWQGEAPNTWIRGSEPIDGLFTTDDVDISAYTMLSFHESPGDHRAVIIEVTSRSMLGEFSYKIQRGHARRLTLASPRVIKRYNSLKLKQFNIHRIEQRILELRILSAQHHEGLPMELQKSWQVIHKQIDEIHTYAESHCRILHYPDLPWSEPVGYWANRKRAYEGLKAVIERGGGNLSNAIRTSKRHGIDNPQELTLAQIEDGIAYTSSRLTSLTTLAPGLRRVSQRNQLIRAQESANLPLVQRIRQIQSREHTRSSWRTISHATKDFSNVSVIKTTKLVDGVLHTYSTKEEVEESMQQETISRFTAAHSAPISKTDIAPLLHYFSSDSIPQSILDRSFAIPDDWDDATKLTIEEIIRIFELVRGTNNRFSNKSLVYTEQDFRSDWSSKREMTSSSPSTIHIGHYKAALCEPTLVKFYSDYWTDIIRYKVPPARWFTAVQVALLKEPGNFDVDRLRFIQLYEADFNIIDKWFAKHITNVLTKLDVIPTEHFAVKEKTAEDANMDKTLTFDISRISRTPMVNVSVDAANCFDRICHLILALLWFAITGDWELGMMFLRIIGHMKLFQRTGFGDSNTFVGGPNTSPPFQGKGQGSGGAPGAWIHHSTVAILAYLRQGFGSTFVDPITLELFGSMGRLFVDDTNLYLTVDANYRDPRGLFEEIQQYSFCSENLLEETQRATTCWASLLGAGGGAAKRNKCYWLPIFYDVDQGRWSYSEVEFVDAEILIPQPDGSMVPIKQHTISDAPKELGVAESAAGGSIAQLDLLSKKFVSWTAKIRNSHLPPHLAWLAFRLQIWPGIKYSLGTLTNDMEDISDLFQASFYKLLPSLGIVRSLRKILRTLPQSFGGVGLWHMTTEQLICRLEMLLQHYATDTVMGKKFRAMTSWLQLEIGTNLSPFDIPYHPWNILATHCWHKMLWRTVRWSGVEVYIDSVVIPFPRENDITLMEYFFQHNISGDELLCFNRCRVYLHLLFLSDIMTADGLHLEGNLVSGKVYTPIPTSYKFPPAFPTSADWRRWSAFWRQVSGPGWSLDRVLGRWLQPTHRQWTWFLDVENDTLQCRDGSVYLLYGRTGPMRTRSRRYSITSASVQAPSGIPSSVDVLSDNTVRLINTGPSLFLSASVKLPTSFWDFLASWGGTWMWRKVVNSQPDLAWLCQSFLDNTAIWCADGSHASLPAPDISGAGWIIYDTVTKSTLRGEFFERSNRAGSYRGEMLGTLALHILCLALEKYFDLPPSSHKFLCDNESSLNEARKRRKRVPSRYKCNDVIRQLRWIKGQLRMKFVYEDVEGHADDHTCWSLLTIEQQLNCHCDDLAKSAIATAISLGESIPKRFLFPKERIAVIVNGWKQTTDLGKDIRFHVGKLEARRLLTQSYRVGSELKPPPFTSAQFDEIDWASLDDALSGSGDMYRIWLTKQSSNFCGTARQVARYEGRYSATSPTDYVDDKCPNCGIRGERASHLCCCPDPGRTKLLQEQVHELESWMSNHFHSELTFFIPKYILLRGTRDMSSLGLMSPDMEKIARSQDIIGWRNFTEGKISHLILPMQQEHSVATSSKRSGASWVKLLIQRLLHITHSQWTFRNVSLHHIRIGTRTKERSDELLAEIYRILDMPENEFPSESRYLLDVDSNALRKGSLDTQEKFVYVAKAAIRAGQRSRPGRAIWRHNQRRRTLSQKLGIDEVVDQLRLTQTPFREMQLGDSPLLISTISSRRRPHPSFTIASQASNKRLRKPD